MAAINNRQSCATGETSRDKAKRQKFNWKKLQADTRKAKRTRSYLTDSELEKYRLKLLTKCKEILGTVSGLENEVSGVKSNGAGPMDRVDMATFNQAIEQDYGLLESERRVLNDIQDALQRIEEGTYGLCEQCMKQIPKRRLQILPWARYCVPCKEGIKSTKPVVNKSERRRWAEIQANHSLRLFERWLKTNGIDSQEYYKHMMQELMNCYDDPLRKSLIESIY